MAPSPASARRAVLATAGGLGRALLGLVCLVLIATLIPPLLGYQRYVVVGGSMEPAIHRGSVIFDEIVPVEDLRPGDVITYVPPGPRPPSTHRIISRELDAQGSWLFRTKGDANADPDAQPFVLERPVQARVKLAIPYVGYLVDGAGLAAAALCAARRARAPHRALDARERLARRRPAAGAGAGMTLRLACLGLAAAACAALLSLPASGANFASGSKNTAKVTTDATANYLRLYSDASDPDSCCSRTRASATPARR